MSDDLNTPNGAELKRRVFGTWSQSPKLHATSQSSSYSEEDRREDEEFEEYYRAASLSDTQPTLLCGTCGLFHTLGEEQIDELLRESGITERPQGVLLFASEGCRKCSSKVGLFVTPVKLIKVSDHPRSQLLVDQTSQTFVED